MENDPAYCSIAQVNGTVAHVMLPPDVMAHRLSEAPFVRVTVLAMTTPQGMVVLPDPEEEWIGSATVLAVGKSIRVPTPAEAKEQAEGKARRADLTRGVVLGNGGQP